jgi:hypothetical protein
MGPEVLGDDAWSALFDSGPLAEDPGIAMVLWEQEKQGFSMLDVDQRGASRPTEGPADIGAVEVDD